MRKLFIRLARMKYRVARMTTYLGLANTIMLLGGFGWKWWYIFIVLGIVTAFLFEQYFGIEGETDVSWGQCREWQDFKKDFKEFKDEHNKLS